MIYPRMTGMGDAVSDALNMPMCSMIEYAPCAAGFSRLPAVIGSDGCGHQDPTCRPIQSNGVTCPPGFTVSGAACAKVQDTSLLTLLTTHQKTRFVALE